MNGIRRNSGRKPLAMRPEVQAFDYSQEISDEVFAKLREAVHDLNDPAHKRSIVNGVDAPEDC